MSKTDTGKNRPKTIFGWCMYDWANSAYSTTVVAGLLPAYFADGVVGEEGVRLAGRVYSATELWAYGVSAAAILAFICAPVLGAIADFSTAKKKFLLFFAYLGSLVAMGLYFCRGGDVWLTLTLFVISQFSFIAGNVFYDAFLPQITTEDRIDRISGRGYAFGYVGGGLQFAISLGLVVGHETIGLALDQAVRISMVMAGVWWAGFTLLTALLIREKQSLEVMPEQYRDWPAIAGYTAVGIRRTVGTLKRIRRFRHLVLFLIAFMLYNDGIQTVINMATMYGKDELHLDTSDLMLTLLMVQAVAMVGALLFSRIAERIGTKRAVMLSLVMWSGVAISACFIESAGQYFVLGGMVGLVLGGSQALSRSYYGSMIPESASAEFFGFYSVFEKFSSILGPITFGLIRAWTGSSRMSIASLAVFFLVGLILLALVDEKKAREARASGAF